MQTLQQFTQIMTRVLLLTLALMCENVNAADVAIQTFPPVAPAVKGLGLPSAPGTRPSDLSGQRPAAPFTLASDMPPFKLDHPICPGGFTIAQRYDERNSAGTIIKSVWVRKCTNGRIVYGRKV